MRHGRDEILQDVACQREFGKDQQVGLLRFSLLDEIEVLFEIGGNVAKFGGDLREGEVSCIGGNLTTKK